MRTNWLRLAAAASAAMAASVTLPSAATAQDPTYEIDGYQLSAESAATLGRADDSKNRGIDALGRGDWAAALRQCDAAISGYNSTGLPERGRAANVYRQARACSADALAKMGELDEACERYRDIGYHTLMTHGPAAMCQAREAEEEAAYAAWDDYADSFAEFSSATGRLQTFSVGSPERTGGLTAVAASCARLGAFSREIEGASAATGYCTAIVKFETGDFAGACAEIARSRTQLGAVDRTSIPPERSRHVQALSATLEGLRSTCGNTPSAW